MPPASRPLSPHLQVYKVTLTMAMSIVHRITGAGLYAGTLFVTWWLVAAAIGGGALDFVHWVVGSWLGQLILFFYSWALFHHMLGGIRHFVWDFGAGFSPEGREALAWFTLIGGFVLTVLLWLLFVWL